MYIFVQFIVKLYKTISEIEIEIEVVEEDNCPLGVSLVECAYDPCTFASCSGDAAALCIPNYCGGCTGVFYSTPGVLADCGEELTTHFSSPKHLGGKY